MANPRKRKAIKDGRMEQMIKEQNEQNVSETETVNGAEPPATKTEKTAALMDPFIAKEIEEIDRISSNNKKPTTKKKTTTKKKATLKKKTGGK